MALKSEPAERVLSLSPLYMDGHCAFVPVVAAFACQLRRGPIVIATVTCEKRLRLEDVTCFYRL